MDLTPKRSGDLFIEGKIITHSERIQHVNMCIQQGSKDFLQKIIFL